MLEDSGMRAKSFGLKQQQQLPASGFCLQCPHETPWELFYNKKPDVSDMRIFEAKAYALVPKELRRKLDSDSEIGRFVGYEAQKKA